MATVRLSLLWVLSCVVLCGCEPTGPEKDPDGGALGGRDAGTTDVGDAGTGARWQPEVRTTWQWQLTGTLDTSVDAKVYDIDLFETSPAQVAALQAQGRKVICYFDVAYEPGRPDSNQFTAAVLGNEMEGWPGQRWVDLRSPLVRNIMAARIALAASKGCDAVEPDDVDHITNNPGFPITGPQQIEFCRFLANEAHARGMSVALKNNLDQVGDLVADFDFAINEECVQYDECETLTPFISAGKAVLHVEYVAESQAGSVCAVTQPLGFSSLIKKSDLDAWRVVCP